MASGERLWTLQVRFEERADQPGPDGAVVIGPIALAGRAAVVALVVGIGGGERPQADRREQFPPDDFHDRRLLLFGRRGCWRRLTAKIWLGRMEVSRGPACTTSRRPRKGLSQNALRKLAATWPASSVFAQQYQGVVPQGVDLDGLALPRREDDAVALGVHPGELGLIIALGDQAVGRVHVDVEARAVAIAIDDLPAGRQQQRLIG